MRLLEVRKRWAAAKEREMIAGVNVVEGKMMRGTVGGRIGAREAGIDDGQLRTGRSRVGRIGEEGRTNETYSTVPPQFRSGTRAAGS